jgi:hypothetical protein
MKTRADKLYFYLKLFFWSNIIILIGVLLFLLQIKGPDFGEHIEGNIVLERYVIILTLVAIPGALKLFSVLINKKKGQPSEQFLTDYMKIYMLRAAILDIVVIVNLIGFYIYEASNFVYLTIITLFAICFSFPGRSIMHKDEKEEEIEDKEADENNIETDNK